MIKSSVPVTEGGWEPTIQMGVCPLLDIMMETWINGEEKEVSRIRGKFWLFPGPYKHNGDAFFPDLELTEQSVAAGACPYI